MSDTTNAKTRLAGTAHGAIDGEFVYLTKRVRIPREKIIDVLPSRDGKGATIITDRGATRVCEDFSALMYHLYGADVPNRPTNGGAR